MTISRSAQLRTGEATLCDSIHVKFKTGKASPSCEKLEWQFPWHGWGRHWRAGHVLFLDLDTDVLCLWKFFKLRGWDICSGCNKFYFDNQLQQIMRQTSKVLCWHRGNKSYSWLQRHRTLNVCVFTAFPPPPMEAPVLGPLSLWLQRGRRGWRTERPESEGAGNKTRDFPIDKNDLKKWKWLVWRKTGKSPGVRGGKRKGERAGRSTVGTAPAECLTSLCVVVCACSWAPGAHSCWTEDATFKLWRQKKVQNTTHYIISIRT